MATLSRSLRSVEAQEIASRRDHAVERLTLTIIDTLLAYEAFDDYWLNLPITQTELEGMDFIKRRRVPAGALLEIAEAVAACVQDCLRAKRDERRAA